MHFIKRIIIFVIGFSCIFLLIHNSDFYNTKVIMADINGVPWLYSSLVTLFSIIAGFVIQKEWENWNSLTDSVKGEVRSLRDLWLWSKHLPTDSQERLGTAIKAYVKEMTLDGLYKSSRGQKSEEIERSFDTLQNVMFDMSHESSKLIPTTFSFFSKLMEFRADRLRYSSHHTPAVLRRTLLFSTSLVILLAFFIGIKSMLLDYIFTMAVSLTSFIIYIVVDDLDHPLDPGSWHLTSAEYDELLLYIDPEETL
jgi:hypothetical protein